jgi:pimeloyl-ACP methyl ester carboxylesterase
VPHKSFTPWFLAAMATSAVAVQQVAAQTTRFVAVDTNVKLEVLDWGGSGRPLVLLAGFGNVAHVFDQFAPKFVPKYHVYAITRRGFPPSSVPAFTHANYSADRLGDDVLAVLDSLKLTRPVLAGHSLAGEELSSIGSRHPGRVAGLIYLDAGYGYAFYDPSRGDLMIDLNQLSTELDRLRGGSAFIDPQAYRRIIHQLRDTALPSLERDLDQAGKDADAMPTRAHQPADTVPTIFSAIMGGEQPYTRIPVPILAIYALPHRLEPIPGIDSAALPGMYAHVDSLSAGYAAAFEKGVPSAHVVRLANATHYVFQSNEADVLREMNAFLAKLP